MVGDIISIPGTVKYFGLVYLVAQSVFAVGYATSIVTVSQLGMVEDMPPTDPILSQFGEGLIVGVVFGFLGALGFATIATLHRYSGGLV